MKVKRVSVLATAAIRDAKDGAEFVREVDRIGFDCEVLSAGAEARLAGEGVLSAIPDADGIVGDLGGGSLELVDVRKGRASRGISLPLGVLRLSASRSGEREARGELRAALKKSGLRERGKGRGFYMVGGSWRALARIDMFATDYPLPITHEYRIAPDHVRELRRMADLPEPKWSKAAAPARLASAPVAAMMLDLLVRELEPDEIVVSTFGIREGLLYSELKPGVRRIDPLIEAAREAGGGEHRFGQHGALLDDWIAPLFDDTAAMRRLRLASCLLADVAWQANPGFRADRGVEMALHGNWVAVDSGRPGDHGPGAVVQFRPRPIARSEARQIVHRRRARAGARMGPGDAPRPKAVGRSGVGAEAHQAEHQDRGRAARCPRRRGGADRRNGQAPAAARRRDAGPQSRGRHLPLAMRPR